jgi:ketosteroid isomerase-like protein
MSEENLELVRRWYFSLPDLRDANPHVMARWTEQAFRDFLDEQFEVRLPSDYPEGEPVFRGRGDVPRFIAMLGETWGEWRYERERFFDAGDQVVVFGRIIAKGGASGVPIEAETAHVWTIRGGRATSMHAYRDRAEALEVAGLRE